MTEKNCEKCGYEWFARVSEPKECPRCKTRLDVNQNFMEEK